MLGWGFEKEDLVGGYVEWMDGWMDGIGGEGRGRF